MCALVGDVGEIEHVYAAWTKEAPFIAHVSKRSKHLILVRWQLGSKVYVEADQEIFGRSIQQVFQAHQHRLRDRHCSVTEGGVLRRDFLILAVR